MRKANELWDADKELFAFMRTHCITPEECNFFENMRFKEENEVTLSNDLILSENDNPDKIYIVREVYDEYIVGCAENPDQECHLMNLSEALKVKLSDIGVKGNAETLGEWLRSINYKGVSYNHNYDTM
jgi:hypothetical protein